MSGFENDVMVASNVNFNNNDPKPHLGIINSNGQLLIGAAVYPFIRAGFLSAGTGVTITNGPGTITIGLAGGAVAVETLTGNTGGAISPTANNINILGSGGISFAGSGSTLTATISQSGMTWTDVTSATQALSVQNGYFTDRSGGVTYTLPATASLGDIIIIDGKLGLTTIAQNAGQSIRFSSAITTVGVTGSAVGTNLGDCVTLRCSTAGASTVWIAENFNGNWTIS